MPGRYFIVSPADPAAGLFPAEFRERVDTAYAAPRYNISPSQRAPVLRCVEGELVVSDMRWGFAPRWMKDPNKAQINARSETVFERRMFQQAAKRQRCLVPVSGWYEWQPTDGGKQPWAIHRDGFAPFAFAGLWTVGNDRAGGPEENFLTLTTEPSAQLASIHHRMPVILDADGCRVWLDADSREQDLVPLLVPWKDAFALRRVSNKVSNPRNHGPDCLDAI